MKLRDESELPDSGGKIIKLKDKESVVGVFLGDPYEFSTLWKEKKSSVVPDGTPGAKFRFRVNFAINDGKGGYVAKIFEQGQLAYKRLIRLNNDFQGLENIVVRITRHGSTMNDTEYFIDPVMDPKNPRQLAQVPPAAHKVELLPLTHEKQEEAPPPSEGWDPGVPPDDDIPF